MGWVIAVVLGIAGLLLLFVVLTDGRYLGKGLMRWIYDRAGPALFGAQSEAERWRRLAEKLKLRGDERILDVGTAVGDLPLTLASMPGFRGQAVGADWSHRMALTAAAEAEHRGLERRVTFQVVDIREGLPFQDRGFDVVFCLGLLETLPQPERALRELRRVLAPNGTMVLSLYRQGWSSRIAALSLEWHEQHLSALGLEEVEVGPCRGNQDVVIARSLSTELEAEHDGKAHRCLCPSSR
jgi:ubiquinone/menaquinone biosynthesis C-methylase UbiE